IRGDIDEVPAIAAAREQLFVFQQLAYTEVDNPYQPGERAYMVEDFVASFGATNRWRQLGRRTTINGQVEPTLHLRPGEVQRWRFIHAGTSQPIRPKLVRESEPLTVVEQHLIALDGITTGRIEPVQEVELHPGYRADVMIRAGDRPDRYLLVDEEYEEGDPRRVLARLRVSGRRVDRELPTEEELAPLAPLEPIRDHEGAGRPEKEARFTVNFNVTPPAPPQFFLNGELFDPNAPPLRVDLGKADQWVLSSGPELGHPFHIHVNPFQVMTDDGKIVWKDTLFIPPGKEIRIRTRYERYIGRFVMHCHILDHEDLGMMQQVEIAIPGDAGHGHPEQNVSLRRR
ncbi:MAG TPA: multicopper oxidase domain-containing protein, partial [Myxococcaceae bacterium]|nr:multicopper oxidase domain-containing protein [Myxococcaceae bacterium]